MTESFLEEQLKRIREMSERMSRATSRAAELNDELVRNRAANQQGPLHEVRDLRTYNSIRSDWATESKERSEADGSPARRHTARDSSRRRR
jgi:hypothetical protein